MARGEKFALIEDEGIELVLEIRGKKYRPQSGPGAVIRFQHRLGELAREQDAGRIGASDVAAEVAEGLLSHFTGPHEAFIRSLPVEMQSKIVAVLWEWYTAQKPGEVGPSDPMSAQSGSPGQSAAASSVSGNGARASFSTSRRPSTA